MSPGSVLDDRYELGDSLGSGGMAEVCRAHDRLLGRDVAVKLFGPGIDPHGPARARSEMRTLAGLSHPNLVVVHDAGTDTEHRPPRAYLVMQLIDGPSLTDLLRHGPLPDGRVRHIGVGVAQALAYVHARGVVHRDIKPGNILLDAAGRPFLADFGIAQTLGAAPLTATGLMVGTAAYLSPEQVRGNDVGPATDVFALGLVLLEALTGQREYAGTTVETALARLSRPPAVSGRVPPAWVALLVAMTAMEPGDRPTAAETAALLAALAVSGLKNDILMTGRAPSGQVTVALPDLNSNPPTRTLHTETSVGLHPPAVAEQPTTRLADLGAAGSGTARSAPVLPRRVPSASPARRGRRRLSPRVAAGAAVAVVTVAALMTLTGGSGSASHRGAPVPTGAPGPGRMSPDLDRLQQLVKP